jgi:peptidyl-prolyl cis-trans isomerase A (cyclophilin A)
MKRLILLPILALLAAPLDAAGWESKPGLYAIFNTGQGKVVCRLFPDKAPFTVDNFVGLATGEKMFIDPRDNKAKKAKYYDGTVFHRVIPGFMIQGGDPTASGGGGPGYRFNDETNNGLTFDRNGLLAMANAGPRTNGSQFFITDNPTGRFPVHLNGKHTIFGVVVEGQGVVAKIGKTKNVTLESLRIKRVAAKKSKKKK